MILRFARALAAGAFALATIGLTQAGFAAEYRDFPGIPWIDS